MASRRRKTKPPPRRRGAAREAPAAGKPLDPARLSVSQASQALSAASGRTVAADLIERAIADGAPTNADRTINLLHWVAWMAARSR
jgi:hypothetical protein